MTGNATVGTVADPEELATIDHKRREMRELSCAHEGHCETRSWWHPMDDA